MAEKLTYQDFAKRIKEKYPQYNSLDDSTLTAKILEKYPQYSETVDTGFMNPVKTEETQPTNDTQVEPIKQPEQTNKGLVSTPQQEFLTDEEMQKRAAFEPQLPQESQTKNIQYQQPMTDKTDYMGLFNKKEDVKAANESGVETSLLNEAKNAISKAELDIEDVSNFMSVKNRIQSIEKNFPEYDLGELKTVVSNTSALRKRLPEIEDKISQIENDAFEKHSQYFNQAGTSIRVGDKNWNNYQVEKNNPSLTAAKSFIKASNDLKSLTESIAENEGISKGIGGLGGKMIGESFNISEGARRGFSDYIKEYTKLSESMRNNDAVLKLREKLQDGNIEDITSEERVLLKAMEESDEAIKKYDKFIPLSQKIGHGAGYSVPFMLEFMLSGGGATAAGKAILKQGAKLGIKTTAGKIGLNAAIKIAQTGVHTPFMPSMWKNTAIDVSKGEDFGKALFNNAWQTAAEVGSERIFMANPVKGAGGAANRTLQAMGINFNVDKGAVGLIRNIGEEYAEEKVGEIMTAPKDYKNFKEFWNNFTNIENNLVTFGSVAASVGAMGSVAMAGNSVAKARNEAKLARQEKLLPSDVRAEIDVIIDNKDLTVQEQYKLVGELIGDRIDKGELTENPSEVAATAIAYLNYKTQVNSAEATDSSAKIENGEITVGEVEETDLATQQEQLDYLKKQGVEVPDGTNMDKLEKLYNETKSKQDGINGTESGIGNVGNGRIEPDGTAKTEVQERAEMLGQKPEIETAPTSKTEATADKTEVLTEQVNVPQTEITVKPETSKKVAEKKTEISETQQHPVINTKTKTETVKTENEGKLPKEPFEMTREEYISQRENEIVESEPNFYKTDNQKWKNQVRNDAKKQAEKEWLDSNEKAFIEGKDVKYKPTWALTAKEWAERSDDTLDSFLIESHKKAVEKAISEGKQIPDKVKKEYPELFETETPKPNVSAPIINKTTKTFNTVTKALGLQGKDLVSSLGKTARNGKINGVDVVVQQGNSDNEIIIESMRTPSSFRQKGKATKALQTITEQADKENITLKLRAVPQKGSKITEQQLKSFYEKNGFEFDGIEGTRIPKYLAAEAQKKVSIINRLIDDARYYDKIPNTHTQQKAKAGNDLQKLANSIGYSIGKDAKGNTTVFDENKKPVEKKISVRETQKNIQSHKLLNEYEDKNFINNVNKLISNSVYLNGVRLYGLKPSEIAQGIKNILDGKKTVAANNLLDALEEAYKANEINFQDGSGVPFDKLIESIGNESTVEYSPLDNIPERIIDKINLGEGLNNADIRELEDAFISNEQIDELKELSDERQSEIERENREPEEGISTQESGEKAETSVQSEVKTTPIDKIISASSRFRPKETIVFEKPLVGKSGAKLISYEWKYTYDLRDAKDKGIVEHRVSDWTQAEQSVDTGRDIVHQFTVEMPDGTYKTVSSESVLVLLGITNRQQMKSFPSLVNAVKTLAKQQMQLAILEAQKKQYDDAYDYYSKAEKPEITESELHNTKFKSDTATAYKMGDEIEWQDNKWDGRRTWTPYGYATKETIDKLTNSWIKKQIEKDGIKNPQFQLSDLQNRIKRQEKKVSEITNSVSKQSKTDEDGQKERQGQGRQVLTPTESDITGVKSGDVVDKSKFITKSKTDEFIIVGSYIFENKDLKEGVNYKLDIHRSGDYKSIQLVSENEKARHTVKGKEYIGNGKPQDAAQLMADAEAIDIPKTPNSQMLDIGFNDLKINATDFKKGIGFNQFPNDWSGGLQRYTERVREYLKGLPILDEAISDELIEKWYNESIILKVKGYKTLDSIGLFVHDERVDSALKYFSKSESDITPTEEKKITKATSIKPKNLKDVYKAGREIFGLNRSQALAQAIIVNTVVNKIAKNRGVTPEKAWSEIEFKKGDTKGLKQGTKGAIQFLSDGNAIISALTNPNVSTPLHEIAHLYERYMPDSERKAVLKWAKHKTWTVDTSEMFARGFEKYLATGIAPTTELQKIFDRFKKWLTDIYNGITGSEIDIELNEAMTNIYGQMLGAENVKPARAKKVSLKELEDGLDMLFQIVGEKGAINLDKADEATVRLDNLRVAKEMETSGKNPFSEINISEIKEDYDLTEDNSWKFEADLIEALGRKLGGGRFDYQRKGDVIIRVKGHEPNWSNFNEDIEENGAKAILNVTVGDYNKRKYYDNKTTEEQFSEQYPNVDIINIKVSDGESLSTALEYVNNELKKRQNWAKSFTPKQILLATGNQGTFDETSPNILYQSPQDRTKQQIDYIKKMADTFKSENPKATNKEVIDYVTGVFEKKGIKVANNVIEQSLKDYGYTPKFTEQYQIGTTNAKVRTSREMRGLDAIPKAERVANKDLWQSVVDKIANGVINPRQTVKDILSTSEVETSETKEAVVKWDRWRILKETKYTVEEIEAKQQNNDNRGLVDLFLRKAELEAELQENDLAAEKLGAAWGKAGQFRQRTLEEDMSLAAIIREAQILNGGKKLTALQEKKFEELSKKFESLQAEYDRLKAESEKKQEQAKADEEKKRKAAEQKLINDIQNKLAAQTPKPMRDFDTQFKADIKKQKLTEKENTIKERLRNRLGRLANLQFAVGEEGGAMIIEELSGVIKDMSELGIVKLEQGIDRIIAKVKDYMMSVDKKFDGKNLDKYKNEIGKALNIKKVVDDEYERLINKLVEKSQLGFDTGIKGILNDIVYNRVVSGRNTIDDVVDDIYESVKDRIPNITKRKIRDAISGYGEFRKLSKEETDVAVRELKRQGRLDSSIEDVEQNKLPLRTGVERDVQTQETRQKQARILKEIKERDLVPPPTEEDQEAQWRSGLQAYKRRLENAIADIEKEIATGERKAKTQPKKYNSPEIESLKTELERLKKVREAIDKESGVYVEQRESAIIKATERAIAELEMDIDKLRQGLATDKNVTVKGNIFGLSKPAKDKIVSDRITGLQNLKESLQRELSDLLPDAIKDKALLDKYRKQRERRLEQLKEQQRTKDYGEKPKPYRPPLDKATIEINRAIERLKYDIEKEKEQIRLDNRTWKERLGEGFLNAWSLPKALIASVDLSAPLRQGVVMISKPKTFGKAFAEMFRYAFSKNAYEDWLFDLKGTDDYYEMLENGLYIAEPTAKLAAKEEHFMSNWLRYIDKIPLYGALRAGSERAYIGFLNKLRIDIYRNFRDKLQQQGFTPEEIQKELKSYSHFVNTATGRGKLSVKLGEKEIMNLEGIAPVLNGVFFSPRLIASRLATFNPAFYANMSKETRKDAIKTYLGTIGMIMTTLALVALAYGDDERFEIELDPRSSNFLKIRFNNIYYDLWGGHQQVARTLAQVITGQTKKNGRIQKMTGDKWRGTTRWSTLTNFFMNKVSPTTGTVLGILQGGKTYDGEDMTLMNELINKTVPLYLSDIKEVVEEEGWEFAFITGIPAMFGVGVQTQNRKPKKNGGSGEKNEFDYGLEGIEEIDPFGTFDNSGFEESIPDPEQYGTFPEN